MKVNKFLMLGIAGLAFAACSNEEEFGTNQTFEGNELKIYILQDLQCDFKAYSLLNVDKEFKQIKAVKKMQGDLKDYMAEHEDELSTDVLSECFCK